MSPSVIMARIICMITRAFLLILFICQMLSCEGRQIRSFSGNGHINVNSPSHRVIRKLSSQIHTFDHGEKSPMQNALQKTSAEFPQAEIQGKKFPSLKPTHSTPRNSHNVGSFWANKLDSTVQINCLGEKCLDDFKPTAPGHSPGAGHAKDDKRDPNLATAEAETFSPSPSSPSTFFSVSALVSTNDFRPTDPGSSPGAGHFETKKDDFQGPGYCLSKNCKNDFRPTKPGDSPGDGHTFISNSVTVTSEQGKHPSVAHPHAGGTDDYRSTNPGPSPGAGHAHLNRQEPTS